MRKTVSTLFALALVLSVGMVMGLGTPAPVAAQGPSAPVWHTTDQQIGSGTTTAGSVNKPTNLAAGDLVILVVVKQNSLATANPGIIPPAGFNLIRYEHSHLGDARPEVLAYWKIAASTEPDTYAFTALQAGSWSPPHWRAIAGRVTGHHPATPIGMDTGANTALDPVTSLAIPGIATTRDSVLLVAAVVARGYVDPPTSFVRPATMDEIWAIDGSGSGYPGEPGTGGGKQVLATQGTTGTRTFTWTGAARAAGLMFEILPAGDCTATATGTGTACFSPSHGGIEALTALAAPGLPSVTFPHGMFSFKITGLSTGQTVDVTITLPSAVPVGTVWWKYDNGRWYSLPNLNDNGNNIMVIRLTDGGVGDLDSVVGQITDPGGPGNPMTVGIDGSPVSKASILAPWIVLLAAMMAGAGLFVWRWRRAEA